MTSEKEDISKNGAFTYPKLVGILIVFLGSTIGANSYLVRNATLQVDAPDRFTGTQAASLKSDLLIHERHDDVVDDALAAAIASNNRQIARLNAQYEAILANQERMMDRLDKIKN